MKVKHFILDIDGTIWNTTPVVAIAWNKAIQEGAPKEIENLKITAQMLQKEFGKPMDVIADNLFGPIDAKDKANLLELCCEYEHDIIDACEDDLTYPNVADTILKMKEEHRFYIVSNCQDGYVELVMKKTGITDVVTDYECFGHTGLQKADNVKLILERNQIQPKDAYYIGDIQGDCDSAHQAGIRFIHASYGFGEVADADYSIQSFDELMELVTKL